MYHKLLIVLQLLETFSQQWGKESLRSREFLPNSKGIGSFFFNVRASKIVHIFGFSEISEDKIIPHFEDVVWLDIPVNAATVVKSHQALNTPVTDELELLYFTKKIINKLPEQHHNQ